MRLPDPEYVGLLDPRHVRLPDPRHVRLPDPPLYTTYGAIK